MRNIDEDTITQAVIARHTEAPNARLREVMTSLVQHLHAFAREVKLTEEEWVAGIRFLTEVGHITTAQRQEFNLLSDTLGLSMLVTALNNRKPPGCTEATVFGTSHASATPQGEPCFVSGHVRNLEGECIAGALVQVRQADTEPGVLRSDRDGGFLFRAFVAEASSIPSDGPVGRMLQMLDRHPWRPAHLHFMVDAPGYERLTTHVFRNGDPYLDSDAVFGVRSSLIADWVRHERGATPDGGTSDEPFSTLQFALVLNRAPPQR